MGGARYWLGALPPPGIKDLMCPEIRVDAGRILQISNAVPAAPHIEFYEGTASLDSSTLRVQYCGLHPPALADLAR